MKRRFGLVLVIVLFVWLYGGMNSTFIAGLGHLFGYEIVWPSCAVGVVIAGLFLVGMIMNGRGRRVWWWYYQAAAVWMGLSFLGFSLWLVDRALWLVFSLAGGNSSIFDGVYAGWGIIGLTIILGGYAVWNGRRLTVRTIAIDAAVSEPVRLVQLSDVHLGSLGEKAFGHIIDLVRQQSADGVVITGDLVDCLNEWTVRAVRRLGEIDCPVFFVTGNHEDYVSREKVFDLLSEIGVRVLRNEVVEFKGLQLIGIDHSFNRYHVSCMIDELDVNPERYCVLLYHQPQGFEAAVRGGVNLMLTGHTHFGQIYPFAEIVRLFCRYLKGLYQHDGGQLYVSSGSGNWGPPMRLGSVREITVFEIGKKWSDNSQLV